MSGRTAHTGAIDPGLRIGSVQLAASDLERSIDFYERALGLPLISREDGLARLGPDREHPALLLQRIARPVREHGPHSGLFHVAWLHPTRSALADSVQRVAASGVRFDGASDHGVSEALYLHDPDGLGIELYADRPRERWPHTADGGVDIYTHPLDLEDLLEQSAGEPAAAVPGGTAVGHIHLKVADVPRTTAFYRDVLGFAEQAAIPSAAFLSAGGYHHHVGLNSWQSAGAPPAPQDAPGLRRVTFELSGEGALAQLERRLDAAQVAHERENGALALRDPDHELLVFAQES